MTTKNLSQYFQEAATWVAAPVVGDDFAINIREECLVESHIVDVVEDGVVLAADEGMMRILESYGLLEEQGMAEDQKNEPEPKTKSGTGAKPTTSTHCPGCYSTDIKTYSDGDKECHQCHKTWHVKGVAEADQTLHRIQELAGLEPRTTPLSEAGVKNWIDDLYYRFNETYDVPADISDDDYLEAVEEYLQNEGVDPDHIEDVGELFLDRRDQEADDTDLHRTHDPHDIDDPAPMEAKYQGREVPLGKPMAGDVKKSKVYVKGPKGNVVKVNFGDKKMRIKKSNPKRRKSFRARHNCANPGPRWKARYWSCRAW